MLESPVLQEFVQEAVAERAHKMILRFSCLRMAMIESPPIPELVAAGWLVAESSRPQHFKGVPQARPGRRRAVCG